MIDVNEEVLKKCTTLTRKERLVLKYFYKLPISEKEKEEVESLSSVDQYNLFMSAANNVFNLLKTEKDEGAGS